MKKYIPALILALIIIACEEKEKVVISGQISLQDPEQVYLEKQDITDTRVIDSARVKGKGRFRVSFNPKLTGFYNLTFDKALIPLLIEPGEDIFIRIDTTSQGWDYEVEGSPESHKIKELNDRLRQTKGHIDKLIAEINAIEDLGEDQAEQYMERYDSIINQQRRSSIEFVLNNLKSMASIYALYQTYDDGSYVLGENRDIQFMKLASDSLMQAYPESKHVKAFYSDAQKMIYRAQNPWMPALSQMADSVEGSIPNLRIPDPEGDTISLKKLEGQYILLHFWASWHQGSRQQLPNLNAVYRNHHPKGFEVYSVSMDYEIEDWLNALRFEEVPWIHVSELSYPESYAARIYNVQDLPANFLIDPEGNIIAKNIGMRELNSRLTTLLNE